MPVRASLSTLKLGLLLGHTVEETVGPKDNGRVCMTLGAASFLACVQAVVRLRLNHQFLLVDLGSGRDTR